jgi:hypothetical protein
MISPAMWAELVKVFEAAAVAAASARKVPVTKDRCVPISMMGKIS